MSEGRQDWQIEPCGSPLRGELPVPGDKSISHRAIMLSALAEGDSRIEGFLEAADTRASAAILAQMGVRIEAPAPGQRLVHGVGLHGLQASDAPLDCGNAGTAMRLLTGLLAAQTFDCVLLGDHSLLRRPMQRVIEPLSAMGARIEAEAGGLPPLHIHGGQILHGLRYHSPLASAQVKSAILLAGLYAQGVTEVSEPRPTRDNTERMLEAMGWPVACAPGHVRLEGGKDLRAMDMQVPGDFSSAAFFLVAATLVPGSELLLRGVGLNPRRTGLLEILRGMGADIVLERPRTVSGEPMADLRVCHAPLHGIDIPQASVADMIDEFPILFVAATAAHGTTRVRGAGELRVKESDRIAVMAKALQALGANVEESADGVVIEGGRPLRGGLVDSGGDHRCAMSLAVAALRADGQVSVQDCGNVATSFPAFVGLAGACGMSVREVCAEQ